MSGKVSFEGIGEMSATFYAQEGVKVGQVVKLSGADTVGPCAAGDRFCGVAESVREGCAGVRLGGFVELACEDTGVTVGYVKLAADGSGGVKKAAASAAGQEYLVVRVGSGSVCVKM